MEKASRLFVVEVLIYCILLIGIALFSIYNCFMVYPNSWCNEILYCVFISMILFIAFCLLGIKKKTIAHILWLIAILLLVICPFCSNWKDNYIYNYNKNILKYEELVSTTYDDRGNEIVTLITDFSKCPDNALNYYIVTDVDGLINALKENNRSIFNKVSIVFNENEYKTEDEIDLLLKVLDLNKIYKIGVLRQNENNFHYGIVLGIGGEHPDIIEKISLKESSLEPGDIIRN